MPKTKKQRGVRAEKEVRVIGPKSGQDDAWRVVMGNGRMVTLRTSTTSAAAITEAAQIYAGTLKRLAKR